MNINRFKHVSAGILCLFNGGKTVLLGKEFRYKLDRYCYSEFGGKQEIGETLYETAFRECMEETGFSLDLKIEQVQEAENSGKYIDYINEKSGVFYRMYYVYLDGKPLVEEIKKNKDSQPKGQYEEMVEFKYFNTRAVIDNYDGRLPGTNIKLFPPMIQRLKVLKRFHKV